MANKQLFANNAITTLSAPCTDIATTLNVVDGSVFPLPNSGVGEYFLITLESNDVTEIVKVTSRTGNVLTVVRGQEGDVPFSFPAGTTVQSRITANTLGRLLPEENFFPRAANADVLPKPSTTEAVAYIAGQDNGGNYNLFIKSSPTIWTPTNYSRIYSGGSNTAITSTSINIGQSLDAVVAGKYLIQFTSGNNLGEVRAVTAYSAPNIEWSTPLPNAVATSDGYAVYVSNYTLITESAVGSLALYALIDSQAFTGTPTVPTPPAGNNSTRIANTQYVQTEISGLQINAQGINDIFYENSQIVNQNYTITSGKNAMSAGPITIGGGITVTVPSGSVWTIV